jgi:hypothetical protein
VRRIRGRVPRELALLLLVVGLVGFTWAIVRPAWGAPDEDVHFAYTQTLAATSCRAAQSRPSPPSSACRWM